MQVPINYEYNDKTFCNKNLEFYKLGVEIFNTFVKKYEANNEFYKLRKNIQFFYDNKKLTKSKYVEAMYLMNEFEKVYKKFVIDIRNSCQFVEKASSSTNARKIITGKDWGEAIIELIDFFNKMTAQMDSYIKENSNPVKINDQCNKTKLEYCENQTVCKIRKNLLKKYQCVYDLK